MWWCVWYPLCYEKFGRPVAGQTQSANWRGRKRKERAQPTNHHERPTTKHHQEERLHHRPESKAERRGKKEKRKGEEENTCISGCLMETNDDLHHVDGLEHDIIEFAAKVSLGGHFHLEKNHRRDLFWVEASYEVT